MCIHAASNGTSHHYHDVCTLLKYSHDGTITHTRLLPESITNTKQKTYHGNPNWSHQSWLHALSEPIYTQTAHTAKCLDVLLLFTAFEIIPGKHLKSIQSLHPVDFFQLHYQPLLPWEHHQCPNWSYVQGV